MIRAGSVIRATTIRINRPSETELRARPTGGESRTCEVMAIFQPTFSVSGFSRFYAAGGPRSQFIKLEFLV